MSLPDDLKNWLTTRFEKQVRFDEPMRKHTSFRIGGPADALVFPEDKLELASLIQAAVKHKVSWTIIGNGTNLLVKDHGIRGLVITTARQKPQMEIQSMDRDTTHIRCAAGAQLSRVCRMARDNGLAGMGFALGIPGTVGGAVMMNAGTADGCMQDVLFAIEYVDEAGGLNPVGRDCFESGYRRFGVKNPQSGKLEDKPVVVEAELSLQPGDKRALQQEAAEKLEKRSVSQPGWFGNAGCFFRNPSEQASAGWMIDQAGLKGLRVGDAVVSEKHANFIVNTGKASAEDVLNLSRIIQEKVYRKFQVHLEPEVRIVE